MRPAFPILDVLDMAVVFGRDFDEPRVTVRQLKFHVSDDAAVAEESDHYEAPPVSGTYPMPFSQVGTVSSSMSTSAQPVVEARSESSPNGPSNQ